MVCVLLTYALIKKSALLFGAALIHSLKALAKWRISSLRVLHRAVWEGVDAALARQVFTLHAITGSFYALLEVVDAYSYACMVCLLLPFVWHLVLGWLHASEGHWRTAAWASFLLPQQLCIDLAGRSTSPLC